MSPATHDTLVYRLVQILVKLNSGEKLDPQMLADEFGVTLRTIQRDLNVRFAYLGLEKIEGRYRLDPVFLGKLTAKDIERFAALSGVRGLFPSLSDEFLRDIFGAHMQSAMLVKGHSYESMVGRETLFQELERAIVSRKRVSFSYEKFDSDKGYTGVCPYRIINNKGIWYLAAIDDKLKAFSLGKLKHLRVSEDGFDWDARIDEELIAEDGVWLSRDKQEIVLKVDKAISGYFLRRKLIANQVIEKELEDGGLIISTKVGHPNQILPIVRYWIPHIRIISPDSLQHEIDHGLAEYLKGNSDRE
jgi:predicted DNA-binding transcriptional regulator YafY